MIVPVSELKFGDVLIEGHNHSVVVMSRCKKSDTESYIMAFDLNYGFTYTRLYDTMKMIEIIRRNCH